MKFKIPTKDDLKDFQIWWSDEEICRLNFHSEPPEKLTLEDVEERLFRNKNGRKYVVIEENNENIGYVVGRIIENGLDIGMMVYKKENRNKGLAQKIFKFFKPFMKDFHKIESCTNTDNGKHILDKLGFKQTSKNNFRLKNEI